MENVAIWGEKIPGNSQREKKLDMEIKGRKIPRMFQAAKMMSTFVGKEYVDKKELFDSFTYFHAIGNGWEKETYEDIPTLEVFPVQGSHQAVIVIPGGAYAFKQSDWDGTGKQNEGDRVAKALNAYGISAFVLWYRSNPYYFPVPLLDVQRAIRYLKYQADKYRIDPEQISLLGFSAGGYQSLGFANLICGKNSFPDDYERDAVDYISDQVQTVAAGYPMVTFRANPSGVFTVMPASGARNLTKRESFINSYDLIKQFSSQDIPQFIHYGTKDYMVNPKYTARYIQVAKEKGCSIQELVLEGTGHGYGANPKKKTSLFWIDEYTQWLKRQRR